jgi:hypothetical protein
MTNMPRSRLIKVVGITAAVLVVVGLIAVWVNFKIHRIPIPKREKLADCTSPTLSFAMTVRYHKPYVLVLGLPHIDWTVELPR